MRVVLALALLSALSTVPAVSQAGMRPQSSHGVRAPAQHHRPHPFRATPGAVILGGGLDQSSAAPPLEITPPEPMVPPAPPRRVGDDRPTVEHTDVGVTIIRGPGSRHLAP